jgi:hypothetical protein
VPLWRWFDCRKSTAKGNLLQQMNSNCYSGFEQGVKTWFAPLMMLLFENISLRICEFLKQSTYVIQFTKSNFHNVAWVKELLGLMIEIELEVHKASNDFKSMVRC